MKNKGDIFNQFLEYVIHFQPWNTPRRTFTALEFSRFPFAKMIEHLLKPELIEDRLFPAIELQEYSANGKTISITLSAQFWQLVTEGRTKLDLTPSEKIIQLINRFPYLNIPSGILEEFDGQALDDWAASTGISTGETILCQFILMIWDHRQPWKVGPFVVAKAYNTLDCENYRVIQDWVNEPFLL